MAENISDDLAALLKSIEITKKDAEFNGDCPPKDILSSIRMDFLQCCFQRFNPQAVFDKFLAIENNRNILKNELQLIFKLHLESAKNPASELQLRGLLKKYKTKIENKNPESSESELTEVKWTFPDVLFNVMKKSSNDKLPWSPLLLYYRNFNRLHLNLGILGLLPKGKKYGGFVKALIHMETNGFNEAYFGMSRCIYNSPITSHKKREKWFKKLEIDERDCIAWSALFDFEFPEHADIHKYFGQTE